MKTFEFTEEQIKMIANCIEHKQGNLEYINSVYRNRQGIMSNEVVSNYNKNSEEIMRLQTLLNYINS